MGGKMSSIIKKMIQESFQKGIVISIMTQEGMNSFRHTGIIEELSDDDLLLSEGNGRSRKLAISINSIIKVEI